MKAAVVGPGALGCLFAARLAEGGVNVTLVDYKPDRAKRLQAKGVVVESAAGSTTAKPPVTVGIPPRQDLIIVLVKSHATAALEFPPETPVLSLQNGLGNIEALCSSVGSARVLAGVTSEAAHELEEGRVRHAAASLTTIGSWTSCPPNHAAEILRKGGFAVEITDAPGQTIWEKASINAGINPLTALLDVPNGKLLDIREARELMRDLVVEATKVAATEGYRFGASLVEKAEETCRESAENISSMLQDVRKRKRTEIDALSGEIMRRGQIAALPTPRTRMIWQLVKGLEQR